MSNKIPCGGFYLDDMLNVNDSGELGINGGTPYQQLVTDGNGNTVWEDRLAYETEPVLTEIVPEQSFTGTEMDLTGGIKPIVGQTYTVKFDNTEYECICVDLDGAPAIGNAAIEESGSDTGEPFLLAYVYGHFYIYVIDETSTHTVSVRGLASTIVKLPAKFIDKNASGYIVVHNRGIMTQQEAENYCDKISKNEVVFIIWGGMCIQSIQFTKATDSTGALVSYLSLSTQNNESYLIEKNSEGLFDLNDRKFSGVSFPDRAMGDDAPGLNFSRKEISVSPKIIHTGVGSTDTLFSVRPNGTESKEFKVLRNGEAVTQAVILYSSTSGSSKRFRITVDDTGIISATEVTS